MSTGISHMACSQDRPGVSIVSIPSSRGSVNDSCGGFKSFGAPFASRRSAIPLETACIQAFGADSPTVKIYVNIDRMVRRIDQTANRLAKPTAFYLGKLQDGLALDPLTAYSTVLVPFFARHEFARQVILTKSAEVHRLMELDPTGTQFSPGAFCRRRSPGGSRKTSPLSKTVSKPCSDAPAAAIRFARLSCPLFLWRTGKRSTPVF